MIGVGHQSPLPLSKCRAKIVDEVVKNSEGVVCAGIFEVSMKREMWNEPLSPVVVVVLPGCQGPSHSPSFLSFPSSRSVIPPSIFHLWLPGNDNQSPEEQKRALPKSETKRPKLAAAAEVGEKRKTNTERGEAIEKGK